MHPRALNVAPFLQKFVLQTLFQTFCTARGLPSRILFFKCLFLKILLCKGPSLHTFVFQVPVSQNFALQGAFPPQFWFQVPDSQNFALPRAFPPQFCFSNAFFPDLLLESICDVKQRRLFASKSFKSVVRSFHHVQELVLGIHSFGFIDTSESYFVVTENLQGS